MKIMQNANTTNQWYWSLLLANKKYAYYIILSQLRTDSKQENSYGLEIRRIKTD